MILKGLIGILLLSGSLQILAADNNDKSTKLNYHEVHNKAMHHFQDGMKEYRKKYRDAELQFQKDYRRWEDKKSSMDEHKEDRDSSNFMSVNEIDSKEYVDKYNKYGHTFNPNLLYLQKKEKIAYHKKLSTGEERNEERSEKPGSLVDDINVNYINNKKEMPEDTELITEKSVSKSKENYQENYQNGKELYLKRFKKDFYQNLINIDPETPPPPNDTISMARYIVHTVDWAVLGTLSGRSSTKGAPFVCVKATSDGIQNASSGIPFFYMSPMDLCTQDLQKDNRVSVLVTLSQTDYCRNQNLDPQDPRCAKLTLTGKIKKIKAGTDEEKFAKNALFSRHPAMKSWPSDHDWYFTKLKIGQIILLDQFGGATYIKVKDYLNGKAVEPELRK